MIGAVLCMAFYNVWSRRFIVRSSALGFLCVGMGAGAAALNILGVLTGRVAVLADFNAAQWTAGIYLGIGGGAAARRSNRCQADSAATARRVRSRWFAPCGCQLY
jgi:drug/metabolite transporter (DMT)-like permease